MFPDRPAFFSVTFLLQGGKLLTNPGRMKKECQQCAKSLPKKQLSRYVSQSLFKVRRGMPLPNGPFCSQGCRGQWQREQSWQKLVVLHAEEERVAGQAKAQKEKIEETEETGFIIHDFLEYNPTKKSVMKKRKTDLARKQKGNDTRRSEKIPSGIRTETKTFQEDSRRPDPAPGPGPVPQERDRGFRNIGMLSDFGYPKFGMMSATATVKISKLCPVAKWEWDLVLQTEGKSWPYAAKVIESLRVESAKPKSPAAASRPPDNSIIGKTERILEEWEKDADQQDRVRSSYGPPQGLLPGQGE